MAVQWCALTLLQLVYLTFFSFSYWIRSGTEHMYTLVVKLEPASLFSPSPTCPSSPFSSSVRFGVGAAMDGCVQVACVFLAEAEIGQEMVLSAWSCNLHAWTFRFEFGWTAIKEKRKGGWTCSMRSEGECVENAFLKWRREWERIWTPTWILAIDCVLLRFQRSRYLLGASVYRD